LSVTTLFNMPLSAATPLPPPAAMPRRARRVVEHGQPSRHAIKRRLEMPPPPACDALYEAHRQRAC